MPKAVLLSIKPKYCELIASGKKTIEVCKTKPKLEPPFKCYIYCTKDKHLSFWIGKIYNYADDRSHNLFGKCGNGKVIGEFVCDKIITVDCDSIAPFNKESGEYIDKETCLDRDTLWKYTNGRCAYGWHISDLKIYDEPKELGGFYIADKAAIKLCKHRFRCGQPESVTRHGGWIKGGYGCIKSGEPEWCENCISKPLTRPPQSWCYVEEVQKNDT